MPCKHLTLSIAVRLVATLMAPHQAPPPLLRALSGAFSSALREARARRLLLVSSKFCDSPMNSASGSATSSRESTAVDVSEA
eukprot:CAMPEP_0170585062 /NCGR_PEP_ID=MMETSP0224-20130122/9010_1 /TAXON_ID=285029 /ORGANISM="Togula jolla, Strain CCCM 725" /LENGTH=81 /DNA_ID=CAMNT_0010908515 /DNA_START=698 /DNA_END=939 /DNA_ORIENTATION=+